MFDTAFHSTMPEYVWRYPIAPKIADPHGIRRYGFHGTSHDFVHKRAAAFLGKDKLTCVTLHLGNGASLAAIKEVRTPSLLIPGKGEAHLRNGASLAAIKEVRVRVRVRVRRSRVARCTWATAHP